MRTNLLLFVKNEAIDFGATLSAITVCLIINCNIQILHRKPRKGEVDLMSRVFRFGVWLKERSNYAEALFMYIR
jgi:hypothetical protein